ncbi:MAG TPA: PadR family transcriptional regulator [Solirubrobacteraceae bacterium]|nr:PadR family transcriptional regulator [Solirubrobacteraceae bacterium]
MTASHAAGGRCGHRHERGMSGERFAALAQMVMMRGTGGPGHRGPHSEGGFGFGGPRGFAGPGGFRGRGGKARRGDIRTAALLLLAEEPRNGYAIMQEIEQRSDGVWAPSPGSVYPALAQLEDEGLIRSEEQDGRKQFAITDSGREHLAKRPEDAPAPWDTLQGGVSSEVRELFGLLRQVAIAASQLAQTASETQIVEARKVLSDARRAIYRILGEGDE